MFFRKLSNKIVLAVLIGTTINLSVVSFFAFSFTKAALQKSIMSSQLEIAHQSMDKIDRLLNEQCLDIQILAGVKPFEVFLAHPAGEDIRRLEMNAFKRMTEVAILS